MINSIKEIRTKKDGLYNVAFQIPENEYFNSYDKINKSAADQIVDNYLSNHGDDGNPENIRISHDKNAHVVNIIAELHYLGNTHTETRNIPDVLNVTRANVDHK